MHNERSLEEKVSRFIELSITILPYFATLEQGSDEYKKIDEVYSRAIDFADIYSIKGSAIIFLIIETYQAIKEKDNVKFYLDCLDKEYILLNL